MLLPDYALQSATELLRPHVAVQLTPELLWQALESLQANANKARISEYVKVPVAAERLDCSVRQIFRLIETGRLPAVKLGSRSTRIPVDALEKL
jgi:excisionase family DNA binding protein